MADALLLDLHVAGVSGARWREGFSAFRGESGNGTVVQLSARVLNDSGGALLYEPRWDRKSCPECGGSRLDYITEIMWD